MPTKVADFQHKLLTDEQTRKDFAANPAKVLADNGIVLPSNTKVPANIPLDALDTNIAHVREGLAEQNLTLDKIDTKNPAAVTRFVENAIPVRNKDIAAVQAASAQFVNRGGEVATGVAAVVAVVGAVVVAVVAAAATASTDFVTNPATGLQGISRLGNTFTLHAPNGVRVEGLDAHAVTQIIRSLNEPGT